MKKIDINQNLGMIQPGKYDYFLIYLKKIRNSIQWHSYGQKKT